MKKIYKHPQAIVIANLGPTVMFDTSGGSGGVTEPPQAKSVDFFTEEETAEKNEYGVYSLWED